MKKKWLKYGIIALVITIIIILILLIIIKKNDDSKNNHSIENNIPQNNIVVQNGDESSVKSFQGEKIDVNNPTMFYTIQNCIQYYLDATSFNLNLSEYERDRYLGTFYFENEDAKKRVILNLLSKEYVERNNITMENVQTYSHYTEQKLYFTAKAMQYVKNSNTARYSVYGKTSINTYKNTEDAYFIVTLDEANRTFSIEPVILQGNQSFNSIELKNDELSIEKNGNNAFSYDRVYDKDLVERYLSHYKKLALFQPEEAYEYLDENYKNNNFENVNNYVAYINENRTNIANIFIDHFEKTKEYGKTVFRCTDTKGKMFTITEETTMQYRISFN